MIDLLAGLPAELQNRPDTAQRMADAIHRAHAGAGTLDLNDHAQAAGMSPGHFQRTFAEWIGISPKRFEQHLQKDRALAALRRSSNVLDAALASGLSGPGRLHDLLVTCEAVSPGDVRSGGEGMVLRQGLADSPLGRVWVVGNERGIHRMDFVDTPRPENEARLRQDWPRARFVEDDGFANEVVRACFLQETPGRPLHAMLRGTNFQVKVWEALLRIPDGDVATYQQVARLAGHPTANRAVGSAVGHNPVSVLIPCHRVIRADGTWGNYHWGPERKNALLAWEAERRERRNATASMVLAA